MRIMTGSGTLSPIIRASLGADGLLQSQNARVQIVAGASRRRPVRLCGLGVTVPAAIGWPSLAFRSLAMVAVAALVRTNAMVRCVGISVPVLARRPHPLAPVLRQRPSR